MTDLSRIEERLSKIATLLRWLVDEVRKGNAEIEGAELPAKEELEQAKALLKARGWSYRAAARALGCAYQHLSYVLNGHRESRRLLSAIAKLPRVEKPRIESYFRNAIKAGTPASGQNTKGGQ
jgi:lambda repressor-like predicted transcriptional regulator